MKTKLTLLLNRDVIASAKQYADKENQSLSWIIENYLKALTMRTRQRKEKSGDTELAPITKSLLGSARRLRKSNPEKIREEYLTKKYMR